MTRLGSYRHLAHDPVGCVAWLNSQTTYYASITVIQVADDELVTVLEAELFPPSDLAAYPVETARIIVEHATRQVFAVPLGQDRSWQHRNRRLAFHEIPKDFPCPWELIIGSLCLWDPRDPVALRWRWANGLDAFIAIVQRHLISEEYYRRHGHWPAEDSPHGAPERGYRHPMITPAARAAVA